jgi:hypothetical protein
MQLAADMDADMDNAGLDNSPVSKYALFYSFYI